MLAALAWFCCASAQPHPQPGILLEQIRAKMAANLSRLPNYTCRLTVERSERAPNSRRYAPVDTLRLEVSYVSGKELFAYPGAEKFEEQPLSKLVHGGMTGTGSFALHARAVFLSRTAKFTWIGETPVDGRRAWQFDFRIPPEKSTYQILAGGQSAVVGYHGSIFADAATLDLLRLQVDADDIPAQLNTSRAGETVEYAWTKIGSADFLLPRSSELFMADTAGSESRNRTAFDACRQYAGQSVISFGDDVPKTVEPAGIGRELRIPAGLEVNLALNTVIRVDKAAIGDPVELTVSDAVRRDGAVVVPKGALVTGHLTRVGRRRDGRVTVYVIGMQLERVRHGDSRGEFQGTLEVVGSTGRDRYWLPLGLATARPEYQNMLLPGEGVFLAQGGQTTVVSNVRMVWRTVER